MAENIPSLPASLATPTGTYSKANRRATTCTVQRVYPWLLSASTATAALFCLLYITKPVIVPSSDIMTAAAKPQPTAHRAAKATPALSAGPSAAPGLLPNRSRLPGEHSAVSPVASGKPTPADPRLALPGPPSSTAFEETNLRIQHILTAEAPGGHIDRIDLDVPVLYQSRNLRWTTDEVADARRLLARLMDYQEKSRSLRSEGLELLDSWNRLIGNSIPASQLRADSPSLPANQQDAADSPGQAGQISNESIQLQPAGK